MDRSGIPILRNVPPIAWRPTPRTIRDLELAGAVGATGWMATMVSPELGLGVVAGDALWTAHRFHRSHRLTQASRAGWRWTAYAMLTHHARVHRPTGWGDPVDDFVRVYPEDWLPSGPATPPNPQVGWRPIFREWRGYKHRQHLEGLRVVPRRVYLIIPPWAIINRRAFRKHWNEVHGYAQQTLEHPVDPWRWTWDRGHGRIIGEPFSLPRIMPLPEGWWSWDVLRLGVLEDGTELVWDLLEIPHGLIGGSTRFGKTGCIRTIAFQLIMAAIWNDQPAGVVILDPKGDQFVMFEGLAWDPDTCQGVHVAVDDLSPRGELTTLTNMRAAAQAVQWELGRRRRQSRVIERLRLAGQRVPPPIWRPIVLLVDEVAELLKREEVAKADDSPPAQAARMRNTQRADIERAIQTIARMGAGFRIHVLAAAQSPRAEFLPSDAKVNLAFQLFVGPGSPTELGIIFGKDLPESPPARRGHGVWRDHREGMDPADPYLYLKLYWTEPEMIWDRLDPMRIPEPDPDLAAA